MVMMPVRLRKRSEGVFTSSFPTSSMNRRHVMTKPKSQVQKFKDAAREQAANESEDAFNAALKAVATKKNVTPAIERLADEIGQNGAPKKKLGGA